MADLTFTLEDFRSQMRQIAKLGSMGDVLGMLPGRNELAGGIDFERDIRRLEGMIDAMTPQERRSPDLIDDTRCRRIAAGSGTTKDNVQSLLHDFLAMVGLMKDMQQATLSGRMQALSRLDFNYLNPEWDKFSRWRAKWKRRNSDGSEPDREA